MPCRSYVNETEEPVVLGSVIDDHGNSDDDTWSEDETYQTDFYVQLADQNGKSLVYLGYLETPVLSILQH